MSIRHPQSSHSNSVLDKVIQASIFLPIRKKVKKGMNVLICFERVFKVPSTELVITIHQLHGVPGTTMTVCILCKLPQHYSTTLTSSSNLFLTHPYGLQAISQESPNYLNSIFKGHFQRSRRNSHPQ